MSEMVAAMAELRGIGRIDKHQRYASRFCLVGDELSQLVERPTVVAIASK
jgi:hypothetical protein